MKIVALVVALVCACGGGKAAPTTPAKPTEPTYTMRSYFLVLLRRGPAWSPEKTEETKRLGEGHMANIEAMAKAKKLVLAGPTEVPADDRTAIAGIFLFDAKDRAEVDALLAGDPAIAAGRFVPEVLEWYGPAGITYAGAAP